MLKNFARLFSLIVVLLAMTACGEDESTSGDGEESSEKIKVFTTVYPLQFFTEQIAGDKADVESILPPGTDPHTYEPTSKEMIEIAEADAFIYNGAGLESYAEKISDSIESEDVQILEASKGIDLEEHVHSHDHAHAHGEKEGNNDNHDEHHHGGQDPHVWLDPIRSIQMAEQVKETLVELMPQKEDTFNKNFETLKGELEALDNEFRTEIESFPGNKIIVSHAAYGYWEQAYGIEQLAISGLSPTNEPSQKELEEIIETADKYGLKHVFFEQNVTPKVGDIVREEIGAEALRIHNLSVLTEEDIQNNEDYFTLMQHNLEELTKSLSVSKDVSDPEEQHEHEENHDHGHTHDHSHSHDEVTEKIYEGYFEDSQVKDRPLSDWEGDWQSVYPYLQDGTLDEVFEHKAEDGDKTVKEYKEYYKEGYQTNVDRIVIQGDNVSFFENGEETSGECQYGGHEILTYEAGNRGVRYIFKRSEEVEGLPSYIQFSDHSIDPTEADHYHLYWGDDREALLEEVTNWPTYYPFDLNGHEIAHEMMMH